MNTNFYIRDNDGFPRACVAVSLLEDVVYFTWSVWNPIDLFSKKLARQIAQGRLERVLRDVKTYNVPVHTEGSLYVAGTETAFGCFFFTNKEDIQDKILLMLSTSNEEFCLIPYRLRKLAARQVALSELAMAVKELKELYAAYPEPIGIPVPSSVCQRDVSISDAAGRSDGADDYLNKKQVTH